MRINGCLVGHAFVGGVPQLAATLGICAQAYLEICYAAFFCFMQVAAFPFV